MKTDYTNTMLYDGTVEVKFYGPTPDKPNRHMYYVNGKRVTGVTTFLGIKDKSRVLMGWQQNTIADALITLHHKGNLTIEDIVRAVAEPNKVKQRAADIGTDAHNWAERYIRHQILNEEMPEMPEDDNVLSAITGFLEWVEAHNVQFLSSERLVYSKKHNYVGTMDIEAIVDGKRCLVDLKTSNGLYSEVRMQTAAYLKADEEAGAPKYEGRWAVRLSKESEQEALRTHTRKGFIAGILGKTPPTQRPYVAFEAEYLDDRKDALKTDFEAFRACQTLHSWEKLVTNSKDE